jgi:hypothetical protein
MQQPGFAPPLLREPFMMGPDGMPFLGEMGGSLLPRPFDDFGEGQRDN